ncbi:replication initiation factor domain-containing protein [Burkholderia thailandensis]|uniref:replication initiation factor domain-containing protein n=1 Tax=Burkholderia thailandensis TaxID=57975 RepID=UPI00298FDCAE|nr:replication initiation factor domain-containing protein [Burkholderia thailandensis]
MGKLKSTLTTMSIESTRECGAGDAALAPRARAAVRSEHPPISAARTPECSPATNRGELVPQAIACHETVQLVMSDSGELKIVAVRMPTDGQVAMIDGIRFVINEATFSVTNGVSDDLYIDALSEKLETIFGFGVTRNLNQRRDFYNQTYELGDNYGHVGFGGERQNSTMLIALYGQGTVAAKDGWEARLHDFLVNEAKRPVITRIDLAHDWFDGEVTVEQLDQMHTDGLFTNAHTRPECRHDGDWKFPNGKGRTLYIGTRQAGMMFRGYEKGMQLGDSTSAWVRGEVEISNKSRLIPFDVLLDPSGYYMGSYRKAFGQLSLVSTPKRTEIKRKTASIGVDACVAIVGRQFGKHLGVLADLFGVEELISRVRDPLRRWPDRLRVPGYEFCDTPVHRIKRPQRHNEFHLDPADDDGTADAVMLPSEGASYALYH